MTFSSSQISNYSCHKQHVNRAPVAHSGFSSLVHLGDGNGFAEMGKNHPISVQELYGSLRWAPKAFSHWGLKPHPVKHSGKTTNHTNKWTVFLRSLSFNQFPGAKPQTCPRVPRTHNTQQRNPHKATIHKISEDSFILICGFCPGLARSQANSCIAFLLPQTLQVRQSPVCAGKRPAVYYYALLVHSEKCALQGEKKSREAQ